MTGRMGDAGARRGQLITTDDEASCSQKPRLEAQHAAHAVPKVDTSFCALGGAFRGRLCACKCVSHRGAVAVSLARRSESQGLRCCNFCRCRAARGESLGSEEALARG